jgi:flagellar basal body P-ring formation protein FlgA
MHQNHSRHCRFIVTALTSAALLSNANWVNANTNANSTVVTTPIEWSQYIQRSIRQENSLPQDFKVDIKIGELDPRLTLSPCQKIEPFIPHGTKLWGKTIIGIRCLDGAKWSVTLPIQVSIFGQAIVATKNLIVGTLANTEDFRKEYTELTKEAGSPVSDISALMGNQLSRGLIAGQVLRLEHLKPAPTIKSGDTVKVRVTGQGFSASYDAVALNAAADGQLLRARGENGKILSGTLRERGIDIPL